MGWVHLQHRENFSGFESTLDVALLLVLQFRVLVDSNQRASSQIEVLHHQLSEPIMRVVHLIIKEKGQVELLVQVSHEVIDPIGIDIAQNAFRVEKSRSCGVDLMLLQNLLELRDIGKVAYCKRIGISYFQQVLMLLNNPSKYLKPRALVAISRTILPVFWNGLFSLFSS